LKSPDHVFALKAIRKAYPDAEIVFLHRDPLKVVASCAKLMEELHRPFTNHVDPAEIGRQVSLRLMQSASRMMEAAAGPDRILNLRYADVVADPLGALERIYGHCGLTMGRDADRRLTSFLACPRPRAGRRYSLGEFGLDRASLRERFARYADRFGVCLEAAGLSSA
jgi:hypothetical protein